MIGLKVNFVGERMGKFGFMMGDVIMDDELTTEGGCAGCAL
jgi:hypothetical protein